MSSDSNNLQNYYNNDSYNNDFYIRNKNMAGINYAYNDKSSNYDNNLTDKSKSILLQKI